MTWTGLGSKTGCNGTMVGLEGLSATGLSEAGSASKLSDRASEPHGKRINASPLTALIAVTTGSCSGLDKQVHSVEGCWLSWHAGPLAWQCQQVCQHSLPISTWQRTLQCQERLGGTNKGTAGSMGVSAGVGPKARAGSATSAGTAEVDIPSAVCM